jgi:putative oxidoreductase
MTRVIIYPKWFFVLRILLGILLFMKGIQFIYDNAIIQQVLASKTTFQEFTWLQTIIPWVHLLGGVFITIGMFTRLAIVFQLPILMGAILFSPQKMSPVVFNSSLAYAIIVLVLLLIFLFIGNGPMSWKKMIDKEDGKGGEVKLENN